MAIMVQPLFLWGKRCDGPMSRCEHGGGKRNICQHRKSNTDSSVIHPVDYSLVTDTPAPTAIKIKRKNSMV
jgi:hypothetical protein